jgi:hypothetical protein
MKTKILLSIFLIISLIFLSFTYEEAAKKADKFMYVGVNSCANVCHKTDAQGNMLSVWQNSKHSEAYKVLQSPEADKIAQDKGFTTAAAETPQCLKCHILGKDIDPAELTDTFDKTQGVQCETCHGPGSEYKKISIMKDREKSSENGLIIHKEGETFCNTCHNTDSPTFKGFSYDEYWAKIKHPKSKD